jgi:hypothetical protein
MTAIAAEATTTVDQIGAATLALHLLKTTGGYSMNAATLEVYELGTPNAIFVGGMRGVDGRPVDATVIPTSDVTVETILAEAARVLAETGGNPAAYSGGWDDNGTYYGDASERVADRETAFRLAYRQAGALRRGEGIELAVFDGETGEELNVKGPGRKNRARRAAGLRG